MLQTRSKTDGISFPKGRHFWHRIKYDKSEVVTNIRELTSKTIRWLYFRKRQPAFGKTIEKIIVWRPASQPHWHCEKQLSVAKWNPAVSLCGDGLKLPFVAKALSAEFCLVSPKRSKPDGIFFSKGRHFRYRIKYDKSEVVTNIRELTSKTIRWLYFRKRQPAFGKTIEKIIVWRPASQPHWHCEKQLSVAKWNPSVSLCGNGMKTFTGSQSHSAELCLVPPTRSKPDANL